MGYGAILIAVLLCLACIVFFAKRAWGKRDERTIAINETGNVVIETVCAQPVDRLACRSFSRFLAVYQALGRLPQIYAIRHSLHFRLLDSCPWLEASSERKFHTVMTDAHLRELAEILYRCSSFASGQKALRILLSQIGRALQVLDAFDLVDDRLTLIVFRSNQSAAPLQNKIYLFSFSFLVIQQLGNLLVSDSKEKIKIQMWEDSFGFK